MVLWLGLLMTLSLLPTLLGEYRLFVIGRLLQGICAGFYSFVSPLFRIVLIA